jgi:S1-C subfamily serine protease
MNYILKRNLSLGGIVLVIAAGIYLYVDGKQSPPLTSNNQGVLTSMEVGNLTSIAATHKAAIYRINVGESQGSGVLIKPGLIVTNVHVLAGRTTGIKVQSMAEGELSQEGQLIQTAPDIDIAYIRVNSGGINPIPLSASPAQPGEDVIALGVPEGIGYTITKGTLSGDGRQINAGGQHFSGLLQHSAAINPGSSGGALLNARGELIGINNALQKGTQGIFYAIPSSRVWERLL